MLVPDKYKSLVTQSQLDTWYDDAVTNCCERMEDPSELDITTWAEFCVNERLKQLTSWEE
jgi:hypothetical protein